ncbi:MAG: PAS domain-containing protein [Ramlibacter sp.]
MSSADKIHRIHRLYAVSSGINQAIVRIADETLLYEEACRIAVEDGGLLMAWVGLASVPGETLRVVARWGRDDGYLDAIQVTTDASDLAGRGPGGEAFRTGRPAVCNDIETGGQFFGSREQALARGFRSCGAFPIRVSGQSVGVFLVYAAEPGYFDADELSLLTALADNFSFAVQARQRDVQRRQAEAALRASEARLRALINAEPECVKTISLDARVLDINPAGLRAIEAPSLEAVRGLPVLGFIHPEDQSDYRTLHDRVAAGGNGQLEYRALTRSGAVRWMDNHSVPLRAEDGSVDSVLSVSRDVTARKAAEDETRQLAARLAETLESMTDALVTVDPQWRFTYINREAERVLKRPRHELLGANMWVEFPDGKGSIFEQQYQRAIREQRTVEFEDFYEPLGAWLEVHACPSPQGLTIYFRDASARHEAQDEILRLNAELEQRVGERTAQLEAANRELSAFSYSVAHDLRSPLAAISGFQHALEQSLGDAVTDKMHHYLARMRAGLAQTQDMIDALLALSRVSRAELRWESMDLVPLARAAFDACRQHDSGRQALLQVPDQIRVWGDPRLLQLVMDNLIGNAWKFSAHTDCAVISVAVEQGANGEAVFRVSDNGVGFDMTYADKLFGAFQRLHRQDEFPGTGIGLANVWRIVSMHGGRVWGESAPGQGATFRFTLGRHAPE